MGRRQNRANLLKHDVDLRTAAKVFQDESFTLDTDRIDEEGEQRWHAVGLVDDLPLLVVHMYRSTKKWRRNRPHHLGAKNS